MSYSIPRHIEEKVRTYVVTDLKPSFLLVQIKLGFAVFNGVILSLFICGQFGLSFSAMADGISANLHSQMTPMYCAAFCGAVFSIFPIFMLRMFTTPIQFKVILNNHKLSIIFWFLLVGIVFSFFGHHGNDAVHIMIWLISGLVLAKLWGDIFQKILPVWSFRSLKFGSRIG